MAVSEDVARRYLLGQLPDDEQTAVERDYLANDGAFEELLAVEDDLADEYASGRLSGEERRAFEQRITISPRIAEKVQFARALDSVAAGAHRPARRVSGWLAAA